MSDVTSVSHQPASEREGGAHDNTAHYSTAYTARNNIPHIWMLFKLAKCSFHQHLHSCPKNEGRTSEALSRIALLSLLYLDYLDYSQCSITLNFTIKFNNRRLHDTVDYSETITQLPLSL